MLSTAASQVDEEKNVIDSKHLKKMIESSSTFKTLVEDVSLAKNVSR